MKPMKQVSIRVDAWTFTEWKRAYASGYADHQLTWNDWLAAAVERLVHKAKP